MEIMVCKELKDLSKKFKKLGYPLYIVGGYVRDAILGKESKDIDCVSAMTTDFIVNNFKDYDVNVVNKKLGTVQIRKGDFSVEHTTFRLDFYEEGGEHSPYKVEFTKSIEEDSFRRDFTCNSIYYDIENDKIIDFFGGVEDTKNKIIKAIVSPEYVFGSDGLRLMRLARFASSLSFTIDNETLMGAKEMNFQLNDISSSRIVKELNMILENDNFLIGLEYLKEMELYSFIFKLIETLPFKQNFEEIVKEDFYYLLNKNTPKKYRFYFFLIDFIRHIAKYIEDEEIDIEQVANFVLDYEYFACPKKIAKTVIHIVMLLEDLKNLETNNDYKALILDADEDLDMFIYIANQKEELEKVKLIYNRLVSQNIPLSLKDLAVKGDDVVKMGLKGKNITLALYDILLYGVVYEIKEKEVLLKILKKFIQEGVYE